jgi:hypothetical protein
VIGLVPPMQNPKMRIQNIKSNIIAVTRTYANQIERRTSTKKFDNHVRLYANGIMKVINFAQQKKKFSKQNNFSQEIKFSTANNF